MNGSYGQKKLEHEVTHRVITFLNRQQVDFLDKLSKDFMFESGTKLPRTKLIAIMVDIFRNTGLDIKDAHSFSQLENQMCDDIKKKIPHSEECGPKTDPTLTCGE